MTFWSFLAGWFTNAIGCTIYDLPVTEDSRPACCATLLLSANGVFSIELLSCNQLAWFHQLCGRRGRFVSERRVREDEKQYGQREAFHSEGALSEDWYGEGTKDFLIILEGIA